MHATLLADSIGPPRTSPGQRVSVLLREETTKVNSEMMKPPHFFGLSTSEVSKFYRGVSRT